VLARRAFAFARPPHVWTVEGRDLAAASPAPFPPDPVVDARVAPLADLLSAAGADLVVEHGVLVGEVLGLEVARVVLGADGPRLEVGVGRLDREATAELYAGVTDTEALAAVVDVVRHHRRPGAPPHPLNRLAPERWLRSMLLARPGLIDADHLAPMQPPLPRPNLKARSPAPAVGTAVGGNPLVAVCSTGIDLDLVPSAADVRLAAFGSDPARLVLVLPERDAHPVTRALAGMLAAPAEIVTVPDDWRAESPQESP
jgi:hypothetical protein